jgi:hypothetical protein
MYQHTLKPTKAGKTETTKAGNPSYHEEKIGHFVHIRDKIPLIAHRQK